MTVFTGLEAPASSFLLGDAMAARPDVIVDCERLVPSEQSPLPYLWANGSDLDEFEEALAGDPTVSSVELVETFSDDRLYRVGWTQQRGSLYDAVRERQSTLLEASGSDGTWSLKLRFPSTDELVRFQEFCERHDAVFEVVRVRNLTAPKQGQYGLTVPQREALLTALDGGYFEIPRETTLEDIADALGVSPGATSERLRRAHANVLKNTVAVGRSSRYGFDRDIES